MNVITLCDFVVSQRAHKHNESAQIVAFSANIRKDAEFVFIWTMIISIAMNSVSGQSKYQMPTIQIMCSITILVNVCHGSNSSSLHGINTQSQSHTWPYKTDFPAMITKHSELLLPKLKHNTCTKNVGLLFAWCLWVSIFVEWIIMILIVRWLLLLFDNIANVFPQTRLIHDTSNFPFRSKEMSFSIFVVY